MDRDIWNDIMHIDSAYPKDEIVVEHILRDLGRGQYSLDMRLSCSNPEVQRHLDTAYEKHMYWPRFEKPSCLQDADFAVHGTIWNKKQPDKS